MDDQRISELVEEELARARIGDALQPKPGRASQILRHPLFLAIVAFLMTTVIGGFYDQALKQRRAQEAGAERAVEGMERIGRLTYEHAERVLMLLDALERGDGEEAVKRKAALDAADFEWKTTRTLNLLRIRGFLDEHEAENPYEVALSEVVARSAAQAVLCVVEAYDDLRELGFPELDDDRRNQRRDNCSDSEFSDLGWVDYVRENTERSQICMDTISWAVVLEIRERAGDRADLGEPAEGEAPADFLARHCPPFPAD